MISEHISFKEGTFSATATRLGLPNAPSKDHLFNMQMIAKKIFEPLRVYVGGPIKINSFYRPKKLYRAYVGSSKSQHCQGRALDLDDLFGYKTNAEMFHHIRNNLNFNWLIWKYGINNNPNGVHVIWI